MADAASTTGAEREKLVNERIHTDPLRRFTSTPYNATLSVMGKCVRLDTNSTDLAAHVRGLMSIYPQAPTAQPLFRWKVIVEPIAAQSFQPLTRFGFSEPGFRYASFGQRNFLVLDLASCQAIAYISEEIARDKKGMLFRILDTLFCMTAASLGFVSLFANCVAIDGRGVLLMGAPGSGKTTASYLAAKSGMSLHADEGVFLELAGGSLAGWGGFWPLIFRRETIELLPELRAIGEPFSFGEFSFYHVAKHYLTSQKANPVTPVCCTFLRRGAADRVRISRLSPDGLQKRLSESLLFEEDDQFRLQTADVLLPCSDLPGYEISYPSDPAVVVPILGELLAQSSS